MNTTSSGPAHRDPTAAPAPERDTRSVRASSRLVVGCFLFVCAYFVGIFPGAPDANQRSHYQLLRAMAERGSSEISPELKDLGTHGDVAEREGRRYSDKAPGLSVASLPGYALMRLFRPAPVSTQDWLVFYGARLLTVTLAVGVALFAFVRHATRVGPSPLLPLWLFALLFATPLQVYARSFFSHAFAAALLFLSFVWLTRREGALWAAASGLAAGVAVSSEYPTVTIAVCLLVTAVWTRKPGELAAFVAGAAIPAALLAWYHAHNFGGVLSFPISSSEGFPELATRGVGGVSTPSLEAIAGLFADRAHGLLYFSPFLIAWPFVAGRALRRLRRRPEDTAIVLGPLLLVLLISGFLPPHWRGGWCLGPRYLVAAFLLVFWLLALRFPEADRPLPRFLIAAGVAYGAGILAIAGSTFWMFPYESWNPVRTVSIFMLRSGIVEYNLGVAAGLSPLTSLLPPLLAAGIAFVAALRASGLPLSVRVGATALGAAALLAILAIPPSPHAIESSHREDLAGALAPAMRVGWR
ncbi:MAG TPA: hypothetical protein VIE39_00890 [Thermoanaerobaculia bacterium]